MTGSDWIAVVAIVVGLLGTILTQVWQSHAEQKRVRESIRVQQAIAARDRKEVLYAEGARLSQELVEARLFYRVMGMRSKDIESQLQEQGALAGEEAPQVLVEARRDAAERLGEVHEATRQWLGLYMQLQLVVGDSVAPALSGFMQSISNVPHEAFLSNNYDQGVLVSAHADLVKALRADLEEARAAIGRGD